MSAASPCLGTSRHPARAPRPAPGTPASQQGPCRRRAPQGSTARHPTARKGSPGHSAGAYTPDLHLEGTVSPEDKGTGRNKLLELPSQHPCRSEAQAAAELLLRSAPRAGPAGERLGTALPWVPAAPQGAPPAQIHPSGTRAKPGSCFHEARTREPCDGNPEQLAGARKRCPACLESGRARAQPPRCVHPALNALKSLRELRTSRPLRSSARPACSCQGTGNRTGWGGAGSAAPTEPVPAPQPQHREHNPPQHGPAVG